MILEEIRQIKETKKDLRKFGVTVGTALIVLAALLLWRNKPSFIYFAVSGGGLLISALVFPSVLKPLNKVWMALSIVLGWIMTRVILTILFYLGVTPIALSAKLFKKQFLDLKIDRAVDSYWIKREQKEFDKADYERQF